MSASAKLKKTKVNCESCADELDKDHTGIKCPQDHHLCEECTQQWIKTVMSSGLDPFPPRCCRCNVAIALAVFEMNIKDDKEREFFQMKSLEHSVQLGENEVWVECPSCDYREVRTTSNPPMFVYCKNGTCGKQTCYFCYMEISKTSLKSLEESDDEKMLTFQHMRCWEYGEGKLRVESLIREGMHRRCPNPECHSKGMKDDNCTHMTCSTCRQQWCYVCGLSLDQLDKAPKNKDSIYGHNVNWALNPKRCLMYLSQICEIDGSWPVSDDEALAHFHRIITLRLLKAELDKVGEKKFIELVKVFPAVLGGFSLDDINNCDLKKPLYQLARHIQAESEV